MATRKITASDIKDAYNRIKDHIVATPTVKALTLSDKLNANIYLKLENLQMTGSFKCRGALNKLLQLSAKEKKKGVIACSAGNHAQGVAYHAKRMKIPTTIVMPKNTPTKKVKNTEQWGAKVVLHGDSFDDAWQEYERIAKQKKLTPIHPFDDPDIIAGQGTIALEMLEQHPNLDIIIVPTGGGGLISGISIYAKDFNKKIKIISVESKSFPSLKNLLKKEKKPYDLTTIAEGIAVKKVGKLTRKYIKQYVDKHIGVSENAIEQAIYDLLSLEKLVVEGSAAASLAAICENKKSFKGKNIGLVLCGGNIDQSLLNSVIMRGMMKEGLYALLRFKTTDKVGVLADITHALANLNVNIVEVHHHRLFRNLPLKKAEMDITVETKGTDHLKTVLKSLKKQRFDVKVLQR